MSRNSVKGVTLKGVTLLAACGMTAVALPCPAASLRVDFDESAKGAVTRLSTADGHDFLVPGTKTELFALTLSREDALTNTMSVSSASATSFRREPFAGGVRLHYGAIGAAVEQVVCTVREDGEKLRWRIVVTPKPGWRLEETFYPRLMLAPSVGDDPARTAVVGGTAKGGVVRNPSAFAPGRTVFFGRQPGDLVAQFVSLYDDRHLFYFGSEDASGEQKALAVERRKAGLLFNGRRASWDAGVSDSGFDFVTAALSGTDAKPCAWQDAADFYRGWASRQSWCQTPHRDRADLPAWMRDAPVLVRFYRRDFDDTRRIRDWFRGYWLKEFPGTPLLAALWGWERVETWCSDYFPCHPSDEEFRAVIRDLRASGAHAFPWPSGYHWTKSYGRQPDGSFAFDARARFDAEVAPHAVCLRDGRVSEREPGWLKGGLFSNLCPGDPWTFDWFAKDVCGGLAKRGCEVIQADQIVGGRFHDCWSRRHPHPPGPGRWKTETFRRQLEAMRAEIRSVEPDAVVCYEEPEELFNDLVGVQDYRDCSPKGEWASVFNYLYHEYVPCFQSCLYARNNRAWFAHMAVDGQMPFFADPTPDDALEERLALPNGDFERTDAAGRSFVQWETSAGAHGVDREVRHGGALALRFDTPADTNAYQIARNVALTHDGFVPGRTYRLSAWLRTERKGPRTCIGYGLFLPGFRKSRAHGHLDFPEPSEGWVRRESTFVMPEDDDLTLRFMINSGRGATRVWIDDVHLEELAADGTAKDVRVSCRGWHHRFMHAWIRLYRGEGRPWLVDGRQVRPPRIRCEETESGRPAVHHAAYVSADGRKAVFFANGTPKPQTFSYETDDGSFRTLTIRPDEILML